MSNPLTIEKQVLSYILSKPKEAGQFFETLTPWHFSASYYRDVFKTAFKIYTDGQLPTLAKMFQEGQKNGLIEGNGDVDKLKKLSETPIDGETPEKLIEELRKYEWQEPIPFDSYDAVPFPVEVFPDWIANYVTSLSAQMQVPLEMPALLAFSVISLAAAKIFKIQARPGWIEGLNVYTIVALESGNRKSGTLAAMLEPVHDYEIKLIQELKPSWEQSRHELDCKKAALEDLKKLYIKIRNGTTKKSKTESGMSHEEIKAEIKELVTDITNTPEMFLPSLIADDITMEQMVTLLGQNEGCLGIFAAEGTLFNVALGRYSGLPSYDDLLKAYSGDPIRHDRVGRGRVDVPNPALTIGMSIQPVVLKEIAANAAFRQKGMQARFLYAIPDSPLGYRKIDSRPVSESTRNAYFNGIRGLLDKAWRGDIKEKQLLTLSRDANDLLIEFEKWLEPQLAPDGNLRPIADWTAKLSGAILRIAGLLHVASNFVNLVNVVEIQNLNLIVGADTMSKSIRLCDFLIQHAFRAFDVMEVESEQVDKAKKVIKWIMDNNLQEFAQRDCHAALRGTFYKSDELKLTLDLLIEYGYLREVPDEKIGVGRKQIKYQVNPYTINTKNTINEPQSLNILNVVEDKKIEIDPIFWSDIGREVR